MDTGITIRSVAGGAVADYARPASVPAQQSVATDLAPDKTVTATPDVGSPRQDPLSSQDSFSRQTQTLIDPQTREVISRVVDTRTRQVIRQVPDQALLRTRAYAIALQRGDSPIQAAMQMDISA
jgi:hypothetical protein